MHALWRRVLLVVPLVAALWGAWYGMRWCIGNTMADYAPDEETARVAARLAPGDPRAHLALARYDRISFLPEAIPEALRQYEEAARFDPNNYLVWIEYGGALWEAGDSEGSVKALQRAVELAPNYWRPRWFLGNTLLREGRVEEAFAELRRAGDADPSLRPQIFNMAWQVYKGDLQQVLTSVGNSPQARAQLARYLINLQRFDEAQQLWASLSAAERLEQQETGKALLTALYDGWRFRSALEVQRELKPAGAAGATPEKIMNGGFEADIAAPGGDYFDWQVTPVSPPQFAQVAIDPRGGHNGRGLRIAFNATSNLDFNNVSQVIIVQPSTRYRLSFYVRTESLKSATTLVTEVYEKAPGGDRPLGGSAPLPSGSSGWQLTTIDFTTSATEAILVRLNRPACPDESCPIFGKVWYDDFDLQRLGGGAPAGEQRR